MDKWRWLGAHRRLAANAGLIALGFLAGVALRYFFVQAPELAWACSGAPDPWWCTPREALIAALRWQGMGLIAVIAGALALLHRVPAAAASGRGARVALVAGAAGLLLYAPELSAAGLLLGSLRLVRD